jgi:hypothetical protein
MSSRGRKDGASMGLDTLFYEFDIQTKILALRTWWAC